MPPSIERLSNRFCQDFRTATPERLHTEHRPGNASVTRKRTIHCWNDLSNCPQHEHEHDASEPMFQKVVVQQFGQEHLGCWTDSPMCICWAAGATFSHDMVRQHRCEFVSCYPVADSTIGRFRWSFNVSQRHDSIVVELAIGLHSGLFQHTN